MRAAVAGLALAAVALGVLGGCGDDSDQESAETTTTTSTSTTSTTALADGDAPAPAGDAVTLDADPDARIEAGTHTWVLEVTNTGDDPVTLSFPTSQPGDAVLLDADDDVVHRWSEGRFFAQAVQTRVLGAGEVVEVELPDDDLSAVEAGSYTVRLELAVVGAPEPVEARIRIVAP